MVKEFDIFGVGSLLMDILIQADDNYLIDLNLKKGTMTLVNEKEVNDMIKKFESKKPVLIPGGDVPNTLMAAACLGAKCVLCGKVGDDKYGNMYEEIIIKDNIKPTILKSEKEGTGKVIAFITPDAERTFATHLGASINLEKKDILETDIEKSRYVYVTGYMMETQKEMIRHVLELAKKHDCKIAVDLADSNVISRNKDYFLDIVKKYADILFLNEAESKMFTKKEPADAMAELNSLNIPILIIKIGKEGSLISENGKVFKVDAHKVDAIDTNGAGDTFAGAFLYGQAMGETVKKSAEIATLAASKIVQQSGAKLNDKHKNELKEYIMNHC